MATTKTAGQTAIETKVRAQLGLLLSYFPSKEAALEYLSNQHQVKGQEYRLAVKLLREM